MTHEAPRLLTVADIAKRWNCNPRTIHRMVRRGELTPVMRGPGARGALFFSTADIDAVPTITITKPARAAA